MGMPTDVGVRLGQSAWHLENRGVQGVSLATVYLMFSRDVMASGGYSAFQPKKHPEFGTSCICPFALAYTYLRLYSSGERSIDRPIGTKGPANALLMAPILRSFAETEDRAVRLIAGEHSVVFGKYGISYETDDLNVFGWVDIDDPHPVFVEFVPDLPEGDSRLTFGFTRKAELALPRSLNEAGLLDLPD